MFALRLYHGDVSLENYLNKKAKKGYTLTQMTPFLLFPVLPMIFYQFKKDPAHPCRYRVDSRQVESQDLDDYLTLYQDDGWQLFRDNYAKRITQSRIFYTLDSQKLALFSDEDSNLKNRLAQARLQLKSAFLVAFLFIIGSLLFPLSQAPVTSLGHFILKYLYHLMAFALCVAAFINYFYWRYRYHHYQKNQL